MNAMDVMVRAVIPIKPDDTVAKAVDFFAKHDISALPVVDDNDTVVGIISEADPLSRDRGSAGPAGSWRRPGPLCPSPSCPDPPSPPCFSVHRP